MSETSTPTAATATPTCDGCGTCGKPDDQPSGTADDHIDLPPIKPITT